MFETVIGTFEGECADANITNLNGLDITREVWENVFNSEDYKKAIELGHYIGFLGHPEDPNCMDFKDACIVMTEGHIDDNGKVFGSFNLIDTPVGRIVKSFIDGGVTFGISVRGAGDIVNNSVDPDTFVFRGFDLVTFPAYPESIPEFKEIAASTDAENRLKYEKICAAVKQNFENIRSNSTLDIIKSQFPEQSETYQDLDNYQLSLFDETEVEPEFKSDREVLLEEQVDALVKLLAETRSKLDSKSEELIEMCNNKESEKISSAKKFAIVQRICATQEYRLNKELEKAKKSSIRASSKIRKIETRNKTLIKANQELKNTLEKEKNKNLQYLTKIESTNSLVDKKDRIIAQLQSDLDKTVVESDKSTRKLSNLDTQIEDLKSRLQASYELISNYQDAYAGLYSAALGVDASSISVNASTSVRDLQKMIVGSSNSLNSDIENHFEPQYVDVAEDEGDLVTL